MPCRKPLPRESSAKPDDLLTAHTSCLASLCLLVCFFLTLSTSDYTIPAPFLLSSSFLFSLSFAISLFRRRSHPLSFQLGSAWLGMRAPSHNHCRDVTRKRHRRSLISSSLTLCESRVCSFFKRPSSPHAISFLRRAASTAYAARPSGVWEARERSQKACAMLETRCKYT